MCDNNNALVIEMSDNEIIEFECLIVKVVSDELILIIMFDNV